MRTSVKEASLGQTLAAIYHFHRGELDCAITLAAAGEGILPRTTAWHIHAALQPRKREIDPNLMINWLKHGGDYDEAEISEFEAVVAIARSITKFIAVYKQSHPKYEEFLRWSCEKCHLPRMHK